MPYKGILYTNERVFITSVIIRVAVNDHGPFITITPERDLYSVLFRKRKFSNEMRNISDSFPCNSCCSCTMISL